MKVDILNHLQDKIYKANDYFNREQEKRAKRKFITRADYIFAGFLAVISIILLSAPLTRPTASSPSSSISPTYENNSVMTKGKGKGGVSSTFVPCPVPAVAGQCLPQPTSVTNPQPSQPTVSPPPPVDPVSVISNWNSRSLLGTTGGTGADWLVQQNDKAKSVTGAAFQTDPAVTVNQSALQDLWRGMIAVVGGFLTIIFMLTGYKIMAGAAGFRYANALETLPRVFLAALAALLSLVFIGLILGLENALSQQVVYDTLNHQVGLKYTDLVIPAGQWLGYIGAILADLLQLALGVIIAAIPGIGTFFGGAVIVISAIQIVLDAQKFILSIFAIVFALQLAARFVMIDIYMVVAPLAIGCWALPGQIGQSVTRQWATGFLSLVFVQFLQVICLSTGLLLFKAYNGQGIGADLFNFIGPIAIMWLVVHIPRLFGSSAMGTVSAAGQTLVGTAAAIYTAAAIAL